MCARCKYQSASIPAGCFAHIETCWLLSRIPCAQGQDGPTQDGEEEQEPKPEPQEQEQVHEQEQEELSAEELMEAAEAERITREQVLNRQAREQVT